MKGSENKIVSEKYKNTIVKELEFVIKKIDETSTIEAKLYYFSAVQGILHRILNLEYTEELLLAFYVTNETLKMFQQRHTGFKAGDIAIRLTEEQLLRLSEVTKEFLETIRNDGNVVEVLRKYVVLLYSTTGNGYYLMEKGALKI
ncbi:MAG: hypothetical protein A2026_06765 [Deltaproteobacteria bacterium RBG_19FT_COMBO_46_12]|nr:MAG: hypothetical protein A2026_06765 [Deltaproteobacteria bacterium RBG_19FT_COMBO_46_12]